MPNIKHAFTSTAPEGGDSSKVRTSNWNAEHTLDQYLDYPVQTSVPASPASGIRAFTRSDAGRSFLEVIGPSGIDVPLQPGFFYNTMTMLLPSSGTTVPIGFGSTYTARNNGTSAAQASGTRASTNALTSMNRINYGTGTTTTGVSGVQTTDPVAWRGNAAGLGGFYFHARFGIETFLSTIRCFVGLSANNALLNGDPSALNNSVGIAKDSADSTWSLLTRNATTATKTATGVTVTAGQILDLSIFAPPNGSNFTVRLVDATAGTVYMNNTQITSNLPVNTTFMYMQAHIQATTGATAKVLSINKMYLESDL